MSELTQPIVDAAVAYAGFLVDAQQAQRHADFLYSKAVLHIPEALPYLDAIKRAMEIDPEASLHMVLMRASLAEPAA